MLCPICQNDKYRSVPVKTQEASTAQETELLECRNCGIIFASDIEKDRSYIYTDNYAPWSSEAGSDEELIGLAKRTAFKKQLESIKKHIDPCGKKMLDIGTGKAYLMDEAKDMGFDCYGLEICAYAANIARGKHPGRVFSGYLHEANYEDGSFDVIFMTDVLEHLSDPRSVLGEIQRILKPGGYLFIITPNSDSVTRKILGKNWFQYKYEHVTYFNRRSLESLLMPAGLEIVELKNNVKKFTVNYYYYYFKKYNFFIIGDVVRTVYPLLPNFMRNFSFSNPATGEFLAIARKKIKTQMINKIKNFISSVRPKSFFLVLAFVFAFFLILSPPIDPDFGWHFKNGEYLTSHGFQVARSDIFSYSMSDFPVIMHEWLTEIVMWNVSHFLGFFSLSVLFAAITVSAFVLVSWGVDSKKEYKMIAAILGLIASLPVIGVRPQMISLLGLALVVFIVFKIRQDVKTRLKYWLPLIFLLWANLHGGFSIGLFFMAVFLLLETARWGAIHILHSDRFDLFKYVKKIEGWLKNGSLLGKEIWLLLLIWIVSFLATLINPYGWHIYTEVYNTIFDSFAKVNIIEWQSFNVFSPTGYKFTIYLVLLAILLVMNFRKIDYTYLITTIIFLILGFSSWRHLPIFVIISTPLWVIIVESLTGEELWKITRNKLVILGMVIAVVLLAKGSVMATWEACKSPEMISRAGGYPYAAVNFLRDNPIEGNMYNEYNWGGYLIWQYPEKKVFIDGRMASWRLPDREIFKDFVKVGEFSENWKDVLDKYNADSALIFNTGQGESSFVNIGWKEVYKDNLSLVFVRSK